MSAFDLAVTQIASDRRGSVRPRNVRLVRERYVGNIGMLALVYSDSSGVLNRALCGVQWGATGQLRLSGGASAREHVTSCAGPWQMSGGWSNGDQEQCYGGWLSHPEARHARITDVYGVVASDDPVNGVALFICPRDFNVKGLRLELFTEGWEPVRDA
ncbi:MAG: hypothetical protein H0V48_06875 [Nocardioidaceae bacterium]|nr:hypothetical protein [Nocardioidaceae bacterium]